MLKELLILVEDEITVLAVDTTVFPAIVLVRFKEDEYDAIYVYETDNTAAIERIIGNGKHVYWKNMNGFLKNKDKYKLRFDTNRRLISIEVKSEGREWVAMDKDKLPKEVVSLLNNPRYNTKVRG